MKAIVFAAGLGTRLRPLTDSIPKALVAVGGVPMLERVVGKLTAAGFDDIVVNTHHFSDKVRSFLEDMGLPPGVRVRVSSEIGHPLETGGALRFARPLLEGSGRFLAHNVDILSDMDLSALWEASRSNGALATLAVQERESDRYLLFDDSFRLAGWTNVVTGEVKSPYPGLDPSGFRRLAFTGVHVISDDVFPLMEDWPESFGIVDFYLKNAASHCIRGVLQENLSFVDIGSPESLLSAQALFRGKDDEIRQ